MAEVTLRARGPASPHTVWRRYVEPQQWGTWSPQVRGVDYPHGRLVSGTSGRVRGPCGVVVAFWIGAVDDQARMWSWTVQPQLAGRAVARVVLDHGVQARDGGSVTWLRLRGAAVVIGVYAPVAAYALRRLVRLPG